MYPANPVPPRLLTVFWRAAQSARDSPRSTSDRSWRRTRGWGRGRGRYRVRRRWRDRQNQYKLEYRERWDEYLSLHPEWEGLVFTTRYGSPISARNLLRHFKNTLSAAGLPEIRFHDLRHTTATLLLALGVDMKTIQTVLGHSQISLTMNTYAHVLPAMTEEALQRVESVFRERN